MKNIINCLRAPIGKWARLTLLGAAIISNNEAVRAQVSTNLFTFDTSATGSWGSWQSEWEGLWDGTTDHTGNGGGSLYWYQDVSLDNGVQIFNTWGGNPYYGGNPIKYIDLSTATNISFWVKWDTNYSTLGINDFNTQDYASPAGNGDHGIAVGVITVTTPGGQGTVLGNAYIPFAASNGWAQVNVPISTLSLAHPNEATTLTLFKWSNTAPPNSGIFAFWIDDIQAESPGAPPPPPILSNFSPPRKGLNIYDDGNAYDRQNIATVVTNGGPDYNYSWVGSASPVTYSVNIVSAPAPTNTHYQAQIMLFPGDNITESDPDYAETNGVALYIEQQTNGVVAQLRYKVNDAADNSSMYGSNTNIFGGSGLPFTNTIVPGYGGLLCSYTNIAGFIGTWSFTISPSGQVTLTTPGGTATGTFPAGDAASFASPLTVFWGTQPNISGLDQEVLLGSASIGGSANSLNLDLTQPLNASQVIVNASTPNLVVTTPTNSAYSLQWTLPAVNYALYSASNLAGPWSPVIGSTIPVTNFLNTFDTSSSFENSRDYNPPPMGAAYDFGDDNTATVTWAAGPTYDAAGSAGSGSMKFSWSFAGGSGNEAFTMDLFPSGQSFLGSTLSFDIYIDPSSTAGTNSDYGYLNVVTRDSSYTWNPTTLAESMLTAAGGSVGQWSHVTIPLGTGADAVVRGLTLQVSNDGGIAGPEIFYIDNLKIVNTSPLPPTARTLGGKSSVFITTPMLPSTATGYFRLINP